MDLRDFFAAQVMSYFHQGYPSYSLVDVAKLSYKYADAMIIAREQKSDQSSI
jgi:hypothetical protein